MLKHDVMLQDAAMSVLWKLPYNSRRRAFRRFAPAYHRHFQALRLADTNRGRSLKPFDVHRCIFVHITKCAGISVSRSLFGNLGGAHLRIPHYQLIFSAHEFSCYFKFTFVRNPWARLVSAFLFLKGGGANSADRAWAQQNLSRFADFDTFVRRWIAPHNVLSWKHFVPQHRFLCEPRGRPPTGRLCWAVRTARRGFLPDSYEAGYRSTFAAPEPN
jgi:hypothetical protein